MITASHARLLVYRKMFCLDDSYPQSSQSNLAVICSNQTVSVDESSAPIAHAFPVKNKSLGTLVASSF